jgi:UDP-N-acetylglucosamine 2-epimerase
MSENTPPTKIACKTAKLLDIPILDLLQLGMLGHHYECPEFLADKISVPGEFIRDLLINCGIDESRVVVTGRPTYDALIRAEESFKKEQICKKFGLDPTRKIVVYATENLLPWETQPLVYALCTIMKKLSDVQFVIKVHPSEPSLSLYERVSKDVGVQCLITRDANIYEILFVCDLMITGFSTAALDAMILDKPVVTMNFTGLEDPIPFAESGAAIGVYRKEETEQAIRDGLYDEAVRERLAKDREKFVFEQAYKKDGKATERIVDLIEQMVSEKRIREDKKKSDAIC